MILRFIALFISCFFWSEPSFAQDLMGSINFDQDYSIRFLSNIFGVVDGVLHGSGSQIFGVMFGVFNSAVLTLGTTILGYTLFVSTLRTAHEGEALGRNWSSMWIPFKSATGFALMLPKASGYSMIQIFTMWVVVQGVGAANLIWNTALDYLSSGGAVIQPNTPPLTKSIDMAGDILRSEVCMFMLEETLAQAKKPTSSGTTETTTKGSAFSGGGSVKTEDTGPIPSFSETIMNPTKANQPGFKDSKQPTLTFPGNLSNDGGLTPYKAGIYNGICGSVQWTPASQNPGSRQLTEARGLAVLQVANDLVPYAQQIAKSYGPFPEAKKDALNNISKRTLIDAGNDYEGIVGPAVNLMNESMRSPFGLTSVGLSGAREHGWILAGSYYQQIITLNRNYATEERSYPSVKLDYSTISSKEGNLPDVMKTSELTTFFKEDNTSELYKYIQKQVEVGGASTGAAKAALVGTGEVIGGVGGQILAVLTSGLSSIIIGYAELWANTGSSDNLISVINPVTSAATLGSGLVSLAGAMWIGGSLALLGLTAAVSVIPAFNSMGHAIQAFLSWLMPVMTVVMITMFVLGATLAYYIPMVPYILFLFGGIGWLIGVIESMAAAPLVAVGIMYPEGGHEIMGKAEPAVMLLTNIFIRPSLMIIGFIAGISLSFVGIWLLNAGFARASIAMTAGVQGYAWIFMPIAMMTIYTALVVQIINQAFALIHILPDEVLRWVGGGAKQLGEGAAGGEAAVRGAFKEDTGAFGKGMADERKGKEEAAKKAGAGGEEDKGGDKHGGLAITSSDDKKPDL